LQAAAQKLTKPPQWTFGGRSGLFVPEKHFIGPAGLPATLQTTEVHPPVPNEWLEQFGLPIADADVLGRILTNDDAECLGRNLRDTAGHFSELLDQLFFLLPIELRSVVFDDGHAGHLLG
jgi:hypothetical protein